jgi:hypothetical protein
LSTDRKYLLFYPLTAPPTLEPPSPICQLYPQALVNLIRIRPIFLPGFRESEDEESNLTAVLDSLIPFIRGNESTVKLPVFLGKLEQIPETSLGDASGKSTEGGVNGKEFAWSRGLGIEHSPVKTRSARKKLPLKRLLNLLTDLPQMVGPLEQ